MATFVVKYPTLVQCCILGFLSSGEPEGAYEMVDCTALNFFPFNSLLYELVE